MALVVSGHSKSWLDNAVKSLVTHNGYIQTEAASPTLVQAYVAFKEGWNAFRSTNQERILGLQLAYIIENSHPAGSKDQLDYAPGSELYHSVHKQYHKIYRDILYKRNYYDIFFLDMEGNCIYSVYKELDFATNFAANGTGKYKTSGLGDAFEAAVKNPDKINVIDWKPYGPSAGALASFLSTGIKEYGKLIGVFCTQMPPESKPISTQEMQASLSTAEAALTKAAAFYMAGSSTCSQTLSETAWEVAVDELSLIPYQVKLAQTDMALVVSGHSKSWLDNAVKSLVTHNGYIQTEAASPTLVQAYVAFKEGWNAFRSTNQERILGLQLAYIIENSHPAGSKDQLDYAPGSELYHSVHKQYHKIYRDILYKRNYYDIFFLDMEGNCIYSVYKELDFATNFAANGTGKYKTSGLGDAFEAAVKNPDKINVIDWKPYGPSAGALASFLSTGIKEYGKLIGVFCTQMPPESKPIDSALMLTETIQKLSGKLKDFNYGNTGASINPPPNQDIADKLIAFTNEWSVQKPLYSSKTENDLKAIVAKDAATGSLVTSLVDSVIGGAWLAAPTIQSYKISMVNRQLELLQHMCRDSVLIGFKGSFGGITRASLAATMKAFKDNHAVIKDGNSKRRLASKTDVAKSETVESLSLLAAAMESYGALEPDLKAIVDGGDATEPVLRKIVESTAAAVKSMSSAASHFATTTRTTTLMALEILAPAPFTGNWAAGQTMRTAALLAESLINQQQLLLPGYQLKHVFLDDKCDPKIASQLVLEKMSTKDTYIGLGGTGCSQVCSQVASTLTAIRLPMLSYACPSKDLSDSLAFPDLNRMGTVTTPFSKVIREVGSRYGWTRIFVVSGDVQEYGTEAEGYAKTFRSLGFQVDYLSGSNRNWNSIVAIMNTIKSTTQGEDRVVFVVGSETYFRKLVCASITQGLKKGLVWLSQGTWRHEWWKKSDMANSFQRQWLKEDSSGTQLKTAFQAFKSAWDAWGNSVSETRSQLQKLYATDQKDALLSVKGTEAYHGIHTTWHPVYRKILYDRGYYDIFMFDLDGNCIYSVYKESDYATSFKTGPWKDSGLGDAFRASIAEPDKIHYIDWKPYGPSGNAPAAFFATGLRDADGNLIGVYSIQLPPEYEKSIEEVQKQCTLDAITDSFDGAINIAGIGKPTKELIEKPLPCFEGHSAQSFLKLLDNHLEKGFPEGDLRTQVADPYHEIKAHVVDATCAFAFTVQYLLQQGYKIQNIQRPDTDLYKKFTTYLKTRMDFQGVSGKVKLTGNDIVNHLAVQQVQKGNKMEIGMLTTNNTIVWDGEGVYNTSWVKEPLPLEEKFPFMMVVYILMSVFAVCCPCFFGIISARARSAKRSKDGEKSAASLSV
eukprot:TRINITY_DN507_c0_g1_i11.p1 TRINITY_DN507_c0_g1~~TRINITY_DN507_c0_g1_i11.p1  ORF type:complete len:1432 (-),score=300.11 TRINITY_DN507_c0_g1_i11:1113-5198(-)